MSSDPGSPSVKHHQSNKSFPRTHKQITAAGMGRAICITCMKEQGRKGVLLCVAIA